MAENEIKSINGRKLQDEKARQDISNLQPKTDETLVTTEKTIVGAINELKTNFADSDFSKLTLSTEDTIDGTKLKLSNGTITKAAIIPKVSNDDIKTVVQGLIADGVLSSISLGDNSVSTSNIQNKSITYNKLDDKLKECMNKTGLQECTWTTGRYGNNGSIVTIYNDTTCVHSNLLYIEKNSIIQFSSTGSFALKINYLGIDGLTYDSSIGSPSLWVRDTYTIPETGYYVINASFNPTSTTEITSENLGELLSKFTLDLPILNIDGKHIEDKSITADKLDVEMTNLHYESSMRQQNIKGFGFGYGIGTDALYKGVVKHDNFYTLADGYKFTIIDTPASTTYCTATVPALGDTSYLSDICIVGDELWCFATGDDTKAKYSNVWRIKYNPYTNELIENPPKFFWCNFGHINCANYNPINDSIIMGNGSADYSLDNKIYIMNNVSKIKDLENGATVSFGEYGIEIDATGYDFGAKLNVFWANERTQHISYNGNEVYVPALAYAYANDVNKMYILAIGQGTTAYTYGTYVEPTNKCPWNGTFNVLASYQIGNADETIGNPGSYDHCGQGGDFIDGTAYIGLGHQDLWWSEISLGKNSNFTKIDKWAPTYNLETGIPGVSTTRGIAVTNDFLIIALDKDIYYIPR